MSDDNPAEEPKDGGAMRRRALLLGAVGASAVVSIRPALAQTAGSVLTCEIPVPDAAHSANWIMGDGSLAAPGAKNAYPGGRTFNGEDVKKALNGGMLPGTIYQDNSAYLNYIRRLQSGTSGFTCYASLQMPRR